MNTAHHTDNGTTHHEHIPVLLPEILSSLGDLQDKQVIDATYGRGGYSRAFLERGAHVYAIDRDPEAVAAAQELQALYPDNFTIIEGRFADLRRLLSSHNSAVAAIVFDLGVSSPQLQSDVRGFSFRTDAPLDMRMEKQGRTAADIVNQADSDELKALFKNYGEEPKAAKIAKAIILRREEKGDFRTTKELADLVEAVSPRRFNQKIHPATRVFQALRIAVNDELQQLQDGLVAAVALLDEGGRLAVVSFHSLEDRIVKRFFASLAVHNKPSRHAPPEPEGAPLNFRHYGKPITADEAAIAANPRCRSAKLRILEKLKLTDMED